MPKPLMSRDRSRACAILPQIQAVTYPFTLSQLTDFALNPDKIAPEERAKIEEWVNTRPDVTAKLDSLRQQREWLEGQTTNFGNI